MRLERCGLTVVGFVMFGLLFILSATQMADASTRAPIPQHVRATLLKDAKRQAAADGDTHPYDIEAVSTTLKSAERVTCNCKSSTTSATAPVYLVAMRGRFSCNTCSRPRGATIPPSGVITLVFIAKTMFRAEFGLSDRYPRLGLVGSPIRLDASPEHHKRH